MILEKKVLITVVLIEKFNTKMNAPKSLLKVINEIESELIEFCGEKESKSLVSLIKKRDYGFSVKSYENKHLWIIYEGVYIGLHRDNEPNISFATSGDNNTSDSKRFRNDEKILTHLLDDLRKLKK